MHLPLEPPHVGLGLGIDIADFAGLRARYGETSCIPACIRATRDLQLPCAKEGITRNGRGMLADNTGCASGYAKPAAL